ncbi:MAG TPA: ABC transporter ATP-binding protein [Geminicoccaceae bacterium]|nr:ABC transporter ATP-binding protein [Geminicoccus sp.]HMU51428.1 ABC transporter ATP-binding protein [Geminicoccaceae bacterium]
MTPKIRIADLSMEYVNEERGERHLAVAGLGLDILANEFLCVVGPSGCGKSTLISAIAGFMRPKAGSVTMNGRPITGPGADRGVVFQEYALLPWKTVRDNVGLGLKFKGVPKPERDRVADRFLALTGLAGAARKYPHELSGGMKQRAAVARTLANAPEVMLLDEPFAAVDAQTRMTLQEELLRVWEESRLTALFVTHSVDEAVFLADRVAVLTPGPGRVKEIVDVPIPRDRRQWASLEGDPLFQRLRDRVMHLVRGLDRAAA